jgi:predicted RNase H-like HicB family nuclease
MPDISYYLEQPYTRVLKRDDEGDILATIAELDGCIAYGSSEAEALQNLREAQEAWLEAAIATGQDIPVPESEEELPSGKFVVRMPRSLHRRLNRLAKQDDVSLNQLLVMAATEHVARREGRRDMRAAYANLARWRPEPVKWEQSSAANIGEYLTRVKEQSVVGGASGEGHHHVATRAARGKG